MNLRFLFSAWRWRWSLNSSPSPCSIRFPVPFLLSFDVEVFRNSFRYHLGFFFFVLVVAGWNLASGISFGLAGRSVAVPSERSISVCVYCFVFWHSRLWLWCCSSRSRLNGWISSAGTNIQTNEEVAIKLVSVPILIQHCVCNFAYCFFYMLR